MNINHDIIKKGGEVSLTLEFEKAGKLELKLPVLSE
jgi:copper(I)-binding protein